jgi:hypothetical protein
LQLALSRVGGAMPEFRARPGERKVDLFAGMTASKHVTHLKNYVASPKMILGISDLIYDILVHCISN